MAKFAKELIASLKQAAAHAGGRKVRGMRVTKVELPDVKAIRRSLRMSQHRFAVAYRIPLPTLKNWEQGRRHPDAPAAAYLLANKQRPKELMEAVAHQSKIPMTSQKQIDASGRQPKRSLWGLRMPLDIAHLRPNMAVDFCVENVEFGSCRQLSKRIS